LEEVIKLTILEGRLDMVGPDWLPIFADILSRPGPVFDVFGVDKIWSIRICLPGAPWPEGMAPRPGMEPVM
jgi:hypothetical protein